MQSIGVESISKYYQNIYVPALGERVCTKTDDGVKYLIGDGVNTVKDLIESFTFSAKCPLSQMDDIMTLTQKVVELNNSVSYLERYCDDNGFIGADVSRISVVDSRKGPRTSNPDVWLNKYLEDGNYVGEYYVYNKFLNNYICIPFKV